MSGTSNVGGSGVYEAGDQRTMKDSEVNDRERYKEGQPHSHLANDSSALFDCYEAPSAWIKWLMKVNIEDERSIANKLAREEKVCSANSQPCATSQLTNLKRQNEPEPMGKEEAESKKNPTLPVRLNRYPRMEGKRHPIC